MVKKTLIFKLITYCLSLIFNILLIVFKIIKVDEKPYSLSYLILYITTFYFLSSIIDTLKINSTIKVNTNNKDIESNIDNNLNQLNEKLAYKLDDIVPMPSFIRDDLFKTILILNSGLAAMSFFVLYYTKLSDKNYEVILITMLERVNFGILVFEYFIFKHYYDGLFSHKCILISTLLLSLGLATFSTLIDYGYNKNLDQAYKLHFTLAFSYFISGYGAYCILMGVKVLKKRKLFIEAVADKEIIIPQLDKSITKSLEKNNNLNNKNSKNKGKIYNASLNDIKLSDTCNNKNISKEETSTNSNIVGLDKDNFYDKSVLIGSASTKNNKEIL